MRKPTKLLPLGAALALLLLLLPASSVSGEFEFNDDFEDLIADESNVDEELLPGSVLLPSDVFNDGKPFFVERDPSTGAIDFNHKKTGNQIDLPDAKPYDATKDSYVSDKKDVIVHHSTPNFHDFLNLPKMYSPENFVSISSSYANLKYQGINKGGASNHREHSVPHIVAATSATPAPTTTTTTTSTVPPASSTKYFYNRPQYTSGSFNRAPYGSTANTGNTGSYYRFPATSGRPITTSTSTTTTTTTTTTPAAPPATEATEAPKTTANPQKQLITRYPYKSTIKNKYLETSEQTRKKFFLPSTLALPSPTTTTTTSTTTTTTTTTTERPSPATPVRTSSTYYSPSSRPHWPSAMTTSFYQTPTSTSTRAPPPPANPVVFVDDAPTSAGQRIKFTMPALKYEGSRPAPFRPMPSQPGADGGPGTPDQYGKIELPKNPAVMSLSDIFNTLEQKKRLEAESNRVEEEKEQEEVEGQTTPPSIVLLGQSGGPKIEQSIDLSDQYVQYEVHPAPARPPAFPQQKQQQQQYPVHQSNGHRPQPPAMDSLGAGGQYVQYEVRQPQLNVVKYGAVPSMNSVVISPNQHSATFVLGSQQSVGGASGHGDGGGHFVGSVSQDTASVAALSAARPPYQMGQVLDDQAHDQTANVGASVQVQVKPQDIIKTSSVRFPSESDDKYDNAPIISGTHKSEVLPPNGHSAPVRPDQMVVFPPHQDIASTLHEVSNRIVFDSPAAPSATGPDTLNQNELSIAPNPHYPADLPEQLTPPPSAPAGPQRPRPPVHSQGPPFRYNEIHRRPPGTYQPSDRPRPGGLTLPNILPQFRPNAKISHGHPPPYAKDPPGTYRVPPSALLVKTGPPLRKPAYPPHDYQPPQAGPAGIRRAPLPTRLVARPSRPQPNLPPASAELENRRHYRLPPPPPLMIKDRVFNIQPPRLQPPPPPPTTNPIIPTGSPSVRPPSSERSNEPLEDSEFHRSPPQILRTVLKDEHQGRPKLEPVVTLQMLQSKKQHGTGAGNFQHQQQQQQEEESAGMNGESGAGAGVPQADREHPVYVVYPVKSTPVKLDEPVVVGQRGEQSPSKAISPGTEYQNTPFSIATHVDQEPILTAKHKKPSAHVRLNFPYSLEKPDPLALATRNGEKGGQVRPHPQQELLASDSEYNLGEEPSGAVVGPDHDQDLISSKLQRFHTDSTPIAIAYTPTESSVNGAALQGNNMRYNKPAGGGYGAGNNYYYSPYGETQTEVSYLKIDDVDEFGNPSRRYEQSFQAPFQASMSLDPVKVTNPYEGWAVVTSSPQALKLNQPQQPVQPVQLPHKTLDSPAGQNAKNSIDRSDNEDTTSTGAEDDRGDDRGTASAMVVTPASASTFDPNSFQPELQGGFRPIYGADMKLSEQGNPDPQRSSLADLFANDDDDQLDRDEENGTGRPEQQAQQPSTKLQLVEKQKKPSPAAVKQEEDPEPGMDLDLEAFFDRLTDYDDGEGGLDDVTMSEETTNETIPSSEEKEQYRAVVEGRSSKGSAAPEVASSSPTESATTVRPVTAVEAEPTATTTPT